MSPIIDVDLSTATAQLIALFDTLPHINQHLNPIHRQILVQFADPSIVFTMAETNAALNIISNLLKQECLSIQIVELFRPIIIDLVARWLLTESNIGVPSILDSSTNDLENMASVFAIILPTVPQIKSFAVKLFSQNPSPIEWLNTLTKQDAQSPSRDVSIRAHRSLMTCFRLLSFSSETFKPLWDWTPLYDLLSIQDAALRYIAIRCLAIILDIKDDQISTVLKHHLPAGANIDLAAGGQTFQAHLLTLIEKERLSKADLALLRNASRPDTSVTCRRISEQDLSPLTVSLCGVLLPRSTHADRDTLHNLVMTSTTRHNLHSIGLALSIGAPVLLEGVTGAGKTALVEEVARVTGRSDLVKIHLGDQTDSKVLLGTYVSTSTPGSFRWQSGVLTTAVREGRWLLIEDIDLAPMEVLSVLLSLLDSRTLFIPSRGEKIKAKEGFQLFATKSMIATRSGRLLSRSTGGTDSSIGGNLWTRVQVNSLSNDELSEIIHERFRGLGDDILPKVIMSVFENIVAIFASPEFTSSQSMVSRVISPRDLMKWCTRIDTLISAKGGYRALENLISTTQGIHESILQDLFSEAVDCFCSMIAEYPVWEKVLIRVGAALEIPQVRVQWYIDHYTPKVVEEEVNQQHQLVIGRVSLRILNMESSRRLNKRSTFAMTAHASKLLERIAVSVHLNEPVLLVGETGTGKTTVVQHLAHRLGQELTVINLSQQSDSSDLLGGFKPVDVKVLAVPLKDMFEKLFSRTFSAKNNAAFMASAYKLYTHSKWGKLIELWTKAVEMAEVKLNKPQDANKEGGSSSKRVSPKLKSDWQKFAKQLSELQVTFNTSSTKFVFSFLEGALVKAVRRGDWILLDEINLATTETLECLSGLLQDSQGSILLAERGDSEPITRHPNFRVFACMNPATDVGKKDLPPGLRNRFTEFYVHPPDSRKADLMDIVKQYLRDVVQGDAIALENIVEFYLEVKSLSTAHQLADGAGQRPHFSMRTLTRALQFVREIVVTYGLRRSMYEAFSMTFLTQLNKESELAVRRLVEKHLLHGVKNPRNMITQVPRRPAQVEGKEVIQFGHFWLQCGSHEIKDEQKYILTPSVNLNLNNLSRVVMTRRFPILIQGPTSSGKTSMIEYLAGRLGHKFVRINNHEHTDLQEYVGTYISNPEGQLVFQEGVLVEALRKGWWIVLDELNLAPSDVLEALNRLLDDNRELVIPETGDIVKPHPDFMLFATQNPAGLYGGRKQLSRAFRNRFLELFFDDIPEGELQEILTKRSEIAPSYAERLVQLYKELMRQRQTTRLFEQGHGFITLRDLFRWAGRGAVGYEQLAMDGYMILAERCRKDEERAIVKKALESIVSKGPIDVESMYESPEVQDYMERFQGGREKVVWTKAMKRLFTLVSRCLQNKEPVLLVGETGCGKTTVCQMLSEYLGHELVIVNCHQNTETADLLGGQRPVRNKQESVEKTKRELIQFLQEASQDIDFSADVDIDIIVKAFEDCVKTQELEARVMENGEPVLPIINKLRQAYRQAATLFEWHDGPLVQSLKQGHLFLLDEISLADDSVLERLNSVLEPHRLLVLAEKGGKTVEVMYGVDNFQFLATMNPGGDYGKKELSPALRNRFTEIWVPAVTDRRDLVKIIEEEVQFPEEMAGFADRILDFVNWFSNELGKSRVVVSLRDILGWVRFMNKVVANCGLQAQEAFVHGGNLSLLDGLGSNASAGGASLSGDLLKTFRNRALAVLSQNLNAIEGGESAVFSDGTGSIFSDDESFGILPFLIKKGRQAEQKLKFTLQAPTTANNAMRVVRALQLQKPVLLEGSPGVGKTSLISALATASAHHLVRINLSEQTDLMDLFGSDLPVEGGNSGEFAWRDAPFLQAMQSGDWVLLDEINLASQSVLEGLNSCLDHRGAVYIPELDKEFFCHKNFRVFAAQNPLQQGGGRKGLPKSFVNRFTQVFVEQLTDDDILFICQHMFPQIERSMLLKMIEFNYLMYEETMVRRRFGRKGSPWEFNLRDVFRWLELMTLPNHGLGFNCDPAEYLDLIYLQRMRTAEDRVATIELFQQVFGQTYSHNRNPQYHLDANYVQVGHSLLKRCHGDVSNVLGKDLHLLQSLMSPMEGLMKCIEVNWMAILTGPASSGKTSLVRLLAHLTGNKLEEFSMNSGVDTMEILGGFEQVDVARHLEHILQGVARLTGQVSRQLLLVPQEVTTQGLALAREISQNLYLLQSQDRFSRGSPDLSDPLGSSEKVMRNNSVESLLGQLRTLNHEFGLEFISDLDELDEKFMELRRLEASSVSGRFEWIDGSLINALEHGYWLLIDNANLSNPSVLDRLNSLMEPNGTLMVNERGLVDGEVRIITPHKNFRIFMTVDPKYGELSRAMRNRGVEITLVDAEWINNPQDTSKITNALSVRGSAVPDLISRIHQYLQAYFKAAMPWKIIHAKDLLLYTRFTVERLQRGEPLQHALREGIQQVYTQGGDTGLPPPLEDDVTLQPPSLEIELTPAQTVSPGNCPHLLDGKLFTEDSKLAMVSLHGSYLMYLLLSDAPSADIWTSAHYFLETSSTSDMALRQKWIKHLLNTHDFEPAARSEALLTQQLLDLLSQSQLLPRLTALKGHLASKMKLDTDFLKSLPADLRSNSNLYWAINKFCEHDDETRSIWIEYQSLARLMGLFLRIKRIDILENAVYVRAGKNPSTAQVSYLNHRKMWEKPLQHQVVAEIYPCLEAIKIIILEWIEGMNGLDQEQTEKLHLFLDKRDMVWETVQDAKVNVGELMILVRMVAEAAQFLLTVSELHFGRLFQSLTAMTEAMVLTKGTLMKDLWKRLHPTVLASEELVVLEDELLALTQQADCWTDDAIRDGDLLTKARRISALPELKETLVDAIATLYFVDQTPENGVALLKAIKHVPEHIRKQIEGVKLTESAGDKNRQLALNFMYPVMDFSSAVTEMTLLGRLVRQCNIATSEEQSHYTRSIVEELRSLYNFSLEKTTRSAVDFVPHKRLLWVLESGHANSEHSKALIPRLVQDILHNWHARLWQNTYMSLQFDSFDGKYEKEHVRDQTAIQGPAKLFQSLNSVAYFNYLTTLPKSAINSLDTQLSQTRALVSHQAQASKTESRVVSSTINLVSAIIMLFDALGDAHPDLEIEQYPAALNSLITLLQSASRKNQDYATTIESLNSFSATVEKRLKPSIRAHFVSTMFELVASVRSFCNVGESEVEMQIHHGKAWVHIGLAFIELYVPDYSLDPTAKPRLMLRALRSKQENLRIEIRVRQQIEKSFSGSEENAHILQCIQELATVEYDIEHFALDVALRPAKTQLESLFQEIWQIQEASVNGKTLDSLLTTLETTQNEAQFDREQLFQDVTQQFIRRSGIKFRPYRDILQPLVVAIYQIKLGVRLVASANALKAFENRDALESIVTCLVRVPDYHLADEDKFDSLHVVTQPASLQVVKRAVFDNKSVNKQWSFYLKHLITAIQHQYREVAASGLLEMSSIDNLDNLFEEVTDIWAKGEEHAARLAVEKESLYKERTKKYDGLDDDAIDEATFKEMFPDFAAEFEQPDESMTIPDDEGKDKKATGVPEVEEKMFDEKDIILIGALHKAVFDHQKLTHCSDKTMSTQERKSRIWSWYRRAADLADVSECSFSYQLDAASQGAHMLSSSLMEDWLTGTDNNYWASEPTYDFYKDQNVAEAVRMVPILERLRNRLADLLILWSEHSILEYLIELCDRMLSFPMDSPIAKLLTGIELLLQKSEDWQSYASKDVSIKSNQEEITSLIVSWRQLELTCWPKLLVTQDRNQDESVFTWWFHFYGSIAKPTREMDMAIDQDLPVDIPAHIKGILGVLDQFLQASSVGEFKSRMNLLRSFHQHLKVRGELTLQQRKATPDSAATESVSTKVADAIWNVHQYYTQFALNVEQYITTLRKPIEKNLKEYVKIATWKDINIHALKASALKTHRKLNKMMRKYREVLRKPLTDIITAYQLETPVIQAGSSSGKKTKTFAIEVVQPSSKIWISDLILPTSTEIKEMVDKVIVPSSSESLNNLERTFAVLKRMTANHIVFKSEDKDPLEELCADIIEQIEDFQKETPSKMTEENKSQLKNLKTIRKRALVDLLRLLQRIGLNRNRKARQEEDLLGYVFQLAPTEIQDFEEQAKLSDKIIPASKQVAQLWKKSDDYFYRIVARMMQLRALSQQPPKDITVTEAERGRSYTEDLMNIVVRQRGQLQSMKSSMDTLRGIAAQFEGIFSLPQARTISLDSQAGQSLRTLKVALDKLVDLFSDAILIFEVSIRNSVAPTRGQLLTIVKQALAKVVSLKKSTDQLINQWYLLPTVTGKVSVILASTTLESIHESLTGVYQVKQSLETVLETLPETHCILAPLLNQIGQEFPTLGQEDDQLMVGIETLTLEAPADVKALHQKVSDEINGCIQTIQLSVQRTRVMLKELNEQNSAVAAAAAVESATAMATTEMIEDEDNESSTAAEKEKHEADEYGMTEGYITAEQKKFASLRSKLDLEKVIFKSRSVNDSIQQLMAYHHAQSAHQQHHQDRVLSERLITYNLQRLYPFIQQYLFLAQHHVFHFVQHHKSINKLTYVLCNTFSTLFTKGYCIPEMEQEMKEGDEENNVAGTGIGDGEGGKDVSDEIEDEEQVLGTQNDEKQEDDKKDTKEEDNGIEMENDFEGQMEDVEAGSEDEKDEDEDEDEEEKEDPDDEIGDVDDDNPEAIDEKMWGDEEAEDARDNDKMVDDDKATEQNEQETDIVAKEEEDSSKKDDKKKKQKNDKKENGPEPEKEEGDEGGDEMNDEQEPEEDDDASEEEFEDHNDEDNAEQNQDGGKENVEIPEAETLELPDDLNLDGEDEKEGDDGDDGEDDPFQDQMDVEEKKKDKEFPDEGEEEEGKDDGEKDEKDDQDAASGEKPNEDEVPVPEEDEDSEMAEPPTVEEEEKEGEEEREDEEEDSLRDDTKQRPKEDAKAKMEENPEENEEDEDDVKQSEQEEQPDVEAEAQQEFGVDGEQGKANSSDDAQAEADSQQQSAESAQTSSRSDQQNQPQDQQAQPKSRGDDNQQESQPSTENKENEPKKRETNPHRSLAEALKNWKQRLQDVVDPEEDEEAENEDEAKDTDDKDAKENEDMQVDENEAFEYVKNDEDSHDMETMGNANEEQMKERNQDMAAIDEDKVNTDDTEDAVADMEIDEKEEDVDMEAPEEERAKERDSREDSKPENASGAFFSQRMDRGEKKMEEDEENEDEDEERKQMSGNKLDEHEPLRPEEIEALREQLEQSVGEWRVNGRDPKEAQELWQKYDNLTQDLALGLCEQLRLILEPTLATKLKGDYRTGKRLNMKKIIPYIASQFKKDKIWLRRTKPSKRQYQVMIAIDDSTSMSESHSIQLAYESLALISKALSQLEVGEIGIMSFGETVKLLHPFDQPFTGESGSAVLQQFGFDQSKTYVRNLMESSIALLQHAKMNQSSAGRTQDLWQLEIIISDGICEDHQMLKSLVRQAADQQIMLIFIILDNKPAKDSIMEMTKASFKTVDGRMQLSLDRYLDTFPFDYYVVLQNINSLPETLADALRQYFSFVSNV